MSSQLKITLVKSYIGSPKKHREVLKGLGLTKLNRTVMRPNHPTIIGMIKKVDYLVQYQVVEG